MLSPAPIARTRTMPHPRRGSRQHLLLEHLHHSPSSSSFFVLLEQLAPDRSASDYRYEVLQPLVDMGWVEVVAGDRYAITSEGIGVLRKVDPASIGDRPSGLPVRGGAGRADPAAQAVPGTDVSMMTGCGRRTAMGSGDQRPPRDREGAAEAVQHPSRRGDRLYYADGRVTTLDGTLIERTIHCRSSLPRTVSQQDAWSRMNVRT